MSKSSTLSPAIIDAALTATFAGFVGFRASAFAVDTLRAAAKLAKAKLKDIPKQELLDVVRSVADFLAKKGAPPCAKDGTPYAGKRLTQWAHDCVALAAGVKSNSNKTPKQPGNPLIDPPEVGDPVTVSKKGANESGAVVYHDSVVVPEMRELAAKLASNKSPEVKRLAELVSQFFAA
jgi:hypothetical protein